MDKFEMVEEVKRLEEKLKHVKGTPCEVWTRIIGYFRPVKSWNKGQQAQYKDRVLYDLKEVSNGEKGKKE